jgi:hypothetical protein
VERSRWREREAESKLLRERESGIASSLLFSFLFRCSRDLEFHSVDGRFATLDVREEIKKLEGRSKNFL